MPASTDYSAVREDLAHQSPKEISAMFGRVAERYDIMNFAMGGGLDAYWRRWRAGPFKAMAASRSPM